VQIQFRYNVAHGADGAYSVLAVAACSPFHCMVQGSNSPPGVEATLFRLSAEDLRGLAVAANALADELQDSDKEQQQRSIEEIIT
jgi:hypothetical protein